MKFPKIGAAVMAGVLLTGATATVSFAQPAPAAGPQKEMRQRMSPEERTAKRAEHLRATLQLRADQEPALRAFLDSGRKPDADRGKFREQRQAMAQMTTPQRLDQMKARMTERQARFDQRAAATKRFYAQLSPTQQKAFDALQSQRGGRHGPGFGGGPRGMHRG